MSDAEPDMIWDEIRRNVEAESKREPMLASFHYAVVLNHDCLEDALSFLLATKLESTTIPSATLRDLIDEAYRSDPAIATAIREDIAAVCDRDPACDGFDNILLYYKGYHALQAYRAAHYFWNQGRKSLARYFQSRISEVFGVDIHPAARIGETAVVENYVSMLHEVTLGGTGKTSGDRHPKVREGVLISAGAKILGNVEVGKNAKVGGGAVVLEDVPPHTTVVGVPARVVGAPTEESPALGMDHKFFTSD